MKKLLKILGILLVIMLVIGIGIFFLEMKTKAQITYLLEETFEPKVDSVEVNLSFFHRFPHPYLCIQNLVVNDYSDGKARQILYLKEADAEVNFLKLLRGIYEIKSVNISDAVLSFYADSTGKNIRLFKYKKRDSTQNNGALSITLPKLNFENIHLSGLNEFKKSEWSVEVQSADFHGVVENGVFDLEGNAVGVLDSIFTKGTSLVKNKSIEISSKIEINPLEQKTSFKDGILNFSGIKFMTQGSIQSQYPNGNYLDLKLVAENEIEGLFGLLPSEIQSQFEQVSQTAQSKVEITVSGLANGRKKPNVSVQMKIEEGEVASKEYGVSLDSLNVGLNILYSDTLQALTVENLSGKLRENPIKLDFKIIDFETPQLTGTFDIQVNLKDLGEFFSIPSIKKMSGNLSLNGALEGMLNAENQLIKSLQGSVDFEDDELVLDRSDLSFQKLNGRIEIKDSLLIFRDLKGDFSNIPFNLNGQIGNSYRLLFSNKKDLEFDLDIYSNSVNLNKVFKEITTTGKKVNPGNHPLNFPLFLKGKIQLKTPRLKYRDAIAQRFSASIFINNGQIVIPKLSTDVLHGHLALNAKVTKQSIKYYELKSEIKLANINTKRLLEIFKNFDQKVITSEQVEGRINADIQLNALIDPELHLPSNGISYVGEYSLKKAELIDFEPIVKALKHIKKDEAAHVLIDNLKGKALYHRHQMYIPYLNLTSNLTSISLYGNRKPNEYMDFNVELSLGELLFGNKKNKRKSKRGKKGNDRGMGIRVNLAGKPGEMKVKPRTKKTFEELKTATNRAYTKVKRDVF